MEKPSTTEGHQSDATSRYSRDGTPDPTENLGNDSERREDRTEQLAELVKDILETAWEDSSTEVQRCLEKTLQAQEQYAGSGTAWRWSYSTTYDDYSRLSRDLTGGDRVTVEGIGPPRYTQIEELFESGAMLFLGGTKRDALLGGYQMILAGCLIRLNECSVEQYPTSVHISIWFEYDPQ